MQCNRYKSRLKAAGEGNDLTKLETIPPTIKKIKKCEMFTALINQHA